VANGYDTDDDKPLSELVPDYDPDDDKHLSELVPGYDYREGYECIPRSQKQLYPSAPTNKFPVMIPMTTNP
jgi:hypothetical protein